MRLEEVPTWESGVTNAWLDEAGQPDYVRDVVPYMCPPDTNGTGLELIESEEESGEGQITGM
jgi:hypothetical protein